MVLRDLDGGHISTVSYDSNAPVERTLKSFAINLTGNPSFGAILNQARGEKVEVVLQQTNATQPGTHDRHRRRHREAEVAVGKDTVEVEVLNLWCSDGMRSLKMNEIQRVRFLNPIMDSEFKKALETLSLSHDTQKKSVSINCVGEGKRDSARGLRHREPDLEDELSPCAGQDEGESRTCKAGPSSRTPPTRTGRTCRMALVSGRPICFQMDLYQPLYVPRPAVELELFDSLRPPTYSGGPAAGVGKTATAKVASGRMSNCDGRLARTARPARAAESGLAAMAGEGGKERLCIAEQLQRSLQQNAWTWARAWRRRPLPPKLGDFFQYAIDKPVTLPRQKVAMLPIVAKDIEGSRRQHLQRTHPGQVPAAGHQAQEHLRACT